MFGDFNIESDLINPLNRSDTSAGDQTMKFEIAEDFAKRDTFLVQQESLDTSISKKDQKRKSKLMGKETTSAKDELEFATNWNRVFVEIYRNLKWLNAYAMINEIAIQTIMIQFQQEFFEINDNVIEKKVL